MCSTEAMMGSPGSPRLAPAVPRAPMARSSVPGASENLAELPHAGAVVQRNRAGNTT